MNRPKFPHSAKFVGVTAGGKTEFLLQLLETLYKNHFEFIMILCSTILDNKTYLSTKWIFDDKNVFIVCDLEGKLNEWINRAKEVVGWLSQNLWALITGVGVLIYTYFMTKTRRG